LRLGVTV